MSISDLLLRETPSGLLFAEMTLIWSASHYLTVKDVVREISENGQPTKIQIMPNRWWLPSVFVRAFVSALAAALMTGCTSWKLVGAVFAATLILPLLRAVINPKYIPELEISISVAFVATIFVLIGHHHLKLSWTPVKMDVADSRIILISLVLAIIMFSLRGGTYIVRGILDKTGVLPKQERTRTGGDEIDIDIACSGG